jgi:hypothetical protein
LQIELFRDFVSQEPDCLEESCLNCLAGGRITFHLVIDFYVLRTDILVASSYWILGLYCLHAFKSVQEQTDNVNDTLLSVLRFLGLVSEFSHAALKEIIGNFLSLLDSKVCFIRMKFQVNVYQQF